MIKYTRKSLAKKLGIGIETLRYYEKLKLIPAPERSNNGYRIYTEEDASKINHILTAKKYGFSLKEIKSALLNAEPKSEEINFLLHNKIQDIDKQISELNNLKSNLLKLIQSS